MGTRWAEGCYRFEDDLLKRMIPKLIRNDVSVVIHSASVLEHLDGRVLSHMDDLFLISGASLRTMKHIQRIKGIIEEVKITYDYEIDGDHFQVGQGLLT